MEGMGGWRREEFEVIATLEEVGRVCVWGGGGRRRERKEKEG